ncbi:hypothetical protein LJR220_004632 [Bradyrhizobium sp. LjRoot220]|uniref:hypothetical protein n=1 Tax=Bradyrhizobium sp. LjRoot220 TaxID=3342284 RepID=UPI003ECE86B0
MTTDHFVSRPGGIINARHEQFRADLADADRLGLPVKPGDTIQPTGIVKSKQVTKNSRWC